MTINTMAKSMIQSRDEYKVKIDSLMAGLAMVWEATASQKRLGSSHGSSDTKLAAMLRILALMDNEGGTTKLVVFHPGVAELSQGEQRIFLWW